MVNYGKRIIMRKYLLLVIVRTLILLHFFNILIDNRPGIIINYVNYQNFIFFNVLLLLFYPPPLQLAKGMAFIWDFFSFTKKYRIKLSII